MSETTALTPAETERLTKRGLRLAQFTVIYNVAEGAIAITVGILAGLVSLIGFGFDSGIESASAVLVGLRLAARLRNGEADEVKERRALKAVAITFFVLAAYVIVEGIRSLLGDEEPNTSIVGLVLLAASVIIMPLLARAKRRVGLALGGDPLILADARRPGSASCSASPPSSASASTPSSAGRGWTPSPASLSQPSPSARDARPGRANSSRTTMTTMTTDSAVDGDRRPSLSVELTSPALDR